MHEVRVEQTSTISLPELIAAVIDGDEVVFTADDTPVAKLIPLFQRKPEARFGSAKGMFIMSPDFDEPLEDFDEYR